jgi:hypothetical protein
MVEGSLSYLKIYWSQLAKPGMQITKLIEDKNTDDSLSLCFKVRHSIINYECGV